MLTVRRDKVGVYTFVINNPSPGVRKPRKNDVRVKRGKTFTQFQFMYIRVNAGES